jgi:hypothetical protein
LSFVRFRALRAVEKFKAGLKDFIGVGSIGGVLCIYKLILGKLDDAILRISESNSNLTYLSSRRTLGLILMAFNSNLLLWLKSRKFFIRCLGESLKEWQKKPIGKIQQRAQPY